MNASIWSSPLKYVLGGMVAGAIIASAAGGISAAAGSPAPGQPVREAERRHETDLMLEEIRALYPQARTELSFAMFLFGLKRQTPSWKGDDLSDLVRQYIPAENVELALAVQLEEWGNCPPEQRDAEEMRGALVYAKEKLAYLPEVRMKLSRHVLEDVFGEDDEWILAQVEQGRAMSREDVEKAALKPSNGPGIDEDQ